MLIIIVPIVKPYSFDYSAACETKNNFVAFVYLLTFYQNTCLLSYYNLSKQSVLFWLSVEDKLTIQN